MEGDLRFRVLVIFISLAVIAICVIALAMEVQYDYIAKEETLIKDQCPMVEITPGEEQIGKGSRSAYYRIYTGEKVYTVAGQWYTLTIKYCIPGDETVDFAHCDMFVDGYYWDDDFRAAASKAKVNQTTTCYRTSDNSKLTVTHDGQMPAQITGVVFLAIIAGVAVFVGGGVIHRMVFCY